MVSFVIIFIICLYAHIKFSHLVSRSNPQVSSFLKQGVFDSKNVFNFRDKGIRFAFGVEGFFDKETKDDPRYVKGFARLYSKKDGKNYQRLLPYKKCTVEDFDSFPAPVPEALGLLEEYKRGTSRYLYCLDWEEVGNELSIWGIEDDEISYQRFEFVLVPCNYLNQEFGDAGDIIAEGCIADHKKQKEYLGNIKLVIYSVEQKFDQ